MRGSDTITKVSGGTELRKSKALTCLVTILRTTHSVKFCRPEGLTEGKTLDSGRGPSVPVPVPESEATRQDDKYQRQKTSTSNENRSIEDLGTYRYSVPVLYAQRLCGSSFFAKTSSVRKRVVGGFPHLFPPLPRRDLDGHRWALRL